MRWRENFSWNNGAVVRWRKELKSGARRGGVNKKSGARPAMVKNTTFLGYVVFFLVDYDRHPVKY